MKQFLGLILAVGLLGSAYGAYDHVDAPREAFAVQRANMNQYMDTIFLTVVDFLREGGLVPMNLPDLDEGFYYKPLLIEYSGYVNLTNGILKDIDKVVRSGDSYMTYNRLLLGVEVAAALTKLTFQYDYRLVVGGLGLWTGLVDGYAENAVFKAEFLVDLYDFHIFMQGFDIVSIGEINIDVQGNILIDWLIEIVINIVTVLFKNLITELVSARVKTFIQDVLDEVNANLFASPQVIQAHILEAMKQFKLQDPVYVQPRLN